jgi:tetratricopeptide (TPR) repeat protein
MRFAEHNCQYCIARIVAILVLLLTFNPVVLAQAPAESASLHVAVHDASGKAVADATVYIVAQSQGAPDPAQPLTTRTDANGNCGFSNLRPGVYAVRVEKAGYDASTLPALSLAANEAKTAHVSLDLEKSAASVTPEFFDAPHFTVSGVTDTTSMGGHGSDAVARTRESLAKDTIALGETAAVPISTESATEASLREKVQREPTSFAANCDLGKLLLAEGKPRDAINYFERAEDAAHDQPNLDQARHDQAELHHLLARAREQLGDPLDAVREYQRAAELDPGESNLFDWGSELLLHHAPEPALEVFSKGNRLFPRSARMLMGLGAARFASGSFDRAVESICRASDLNPADPIPYRFLGTMQSTQTLTADELVARLRRFVRLQPENATANYYLAVGLWKQRKNSPDPAFVAQVNSLLLTALRLEPNFGAAYLQLGIVHTEQKNFPPAVTDYQQALRADSSLSDSKKADFKMTPLEIEETHYRLAQAYRETGETDKAKAELQLYDQISKESAEQAAHQRREIGQFVYSLRDQDSISH